MITDRHGPVHRRPQLMSRGSRGSWVPTGKNAAWPRWGRVRGDGFRAGQWLAGVSWQARGGRSRQGLKLLALDGSLARAEPICRTSPGPIDPECFIQLAQHTIPH
jgi:hypothetical protein